MPAITYIAGYYANAGMLREQQRAWRAYPDDLKAHFHAILTDDGSPAGTEARPHVEATGIASFALNRTLVDVRWNWLFCRNLGVSQATTAWVLLTDIDHLVPTETLAALVGMDLDARNVYRLQRVDAPHPLPYRLEDCGVRAQKRVHPNTWLLTRGMFDEIGGYDERLSGCYGTDGEFRDRVQQAARAVVLLPEVLVRYGREVLPDASTTAFTRKNDPKNDADLIARRKARATIPGWRPLRLTFPWERQTALVRRAEAALR